MTTAAVVTPPAATSTTTTPSSQAATTETPAAGATTTTTPPASTESQAPASTTTTTEQQAAAAAAAPARVVPESYALSLPANTILDQADIADVSAMAKAQQLTQDEAQAALIAYETSLRDQSTKFRTELEADTEVGGVNLAHTQREVLRALDTLVPASTAEGVALRQFLNKSGLGNSLHLVRLLARAGKAMGEDRPVLTNAPTTAPARDMVELFYGKQQ